MVLNYNVGKHKQHKENRLPNTSSGTHLGIFQGIEKKLNLIKIQENIQSATKTLYSLFSAGFHGRNGLDMSSIRKTWITYI